MNCECMNDCQCQIENVNINTNKILIPKIDPCEFEGRDTRSFLEIYKDVLLILTSHLDFDHKWVLDHAMGRDTSESEIIDGISASRKELKTRIQSWKEKFGGNKQGDKIFDDIDKLTDIKTIHPYQEFVNEKIKQNRQVKINFSEINHSLPYISLFLKTKTSNKTIRFTTLVDSGSTHSSITLEYLYILGFADSDIKNPNKYSLSTSTLENAANVILGDIRTTVQIGNIILKMTFLVINSKALKCLILGIYDMRRLKYCLEFINDREMISLTGNNEKNRMITEKFKLFRFDDKSLITFINHQEINLKKGLSYTLLVESTDYIPMGTRVCIEESKEIETNHCTIIDKSRPNTHIYLISITSKVNETFPKQSLYVYASYEGKQKISDTYDFQQYYIDTNWQYFTKGTKQTQLETNGQYSNEEETPFSFHQELNVINHQNENYFDVNSINCKNHRDNLDQCTNILDSPDISHIPIEADDLDDYIFEKNKIFEIDEKMTKYDISTVPEIYKTKMKEMFSKYHKAFAKNDTDFSEFDGFEANLEIDHSLLKHQKQRIFTDQQLLAADFMIEKLVKGGIIDLADNECRYTSSYLILDKQKAKTKSKIEKYLSKDSPSNIEHTPEKNYRLILDARSLNVATKKISPPTFPLQADIQHKIQDKVVSCLDLYSAYYAIKYSKNSQLYTAFYHRNKKFKFKRLVMGCKNSGAYLEAMLNIILDKKNFVHFIEVNPNFNVEYFLNNCIINHADDFLIASTNEKYHILDLEAFFYIMHKFNIRLSLNKSAFFQSEFIFLGIKYNTQNQKMFLDCDRAANILRFRIPRSGAELLNRLQCIAYFECFLLQFKLICYPFFFLLRHESFRWSKFLSKVWNNMRMLIYLRISLNIPCKKYAKVITCDASYSTLSYTISQFNPHTKKIELLSVYSRIMSGSLLNRPILNKESAAIILSLQRLEPIIRNTDNSCFLLSDNKALTYCLQTRSFNTVSHQLAMLITGFTNLKILHIGTAFNFFADLLSREFTRRRTDPLIKDALEKVNANLLPKGDFFMNTEQLHEFVNIDYKKDT